MGQTNLGRVRGSMWYAGTGITGTETTPTVYSDSGVTKAYTLDKYLNTDTGNVYECVTAGAANTAEWVYTGCIQGPMPEVVNSLTSSSTTKALSAAQGKLLNDRITAAGLYPYTVLPKTAQTAYTAQITIENVSTTLQFLDDAENTGTYSYTKTGDADTAVVNVSIGTTIGFPSSGAVITSIGSSEAVIYGYKLFDNDSQVVFQDTPNLWDGINANDENVKAGGTVSETYNGTTVNSRDGIISRMIDGVRTALYPITHAKATWFNKQANKTMYDAVTDIYGANDVFDPAKTYAAGDYTIFGSALYQFKTAHTGAWVGTDAEKKSLSAINTHLFDRSKIRFGSVSQAQTSATTITFDEPFEDSNYIVLLTATNSNTSVAFTSYVTSKTATGFSYRQRYQATSGGSWVDYQGGVYWVAIHL